MEIVGRYNALFRRLQHDNLPGFVADQILRMCGVPSLNYLSRVVPPIFLEKAALKFDEWSRDAFINKHNFDPHSFTYSKWKQLSLPTSLRGMCLRQHAQIGRYAFCGAIASASRYFKDRGITDFLTSSGVYASMVTD